MRTNEAARDLWRQLFERAIALPDAALDRSTPEDERVRLDNLRTALKAAGWSDADIEVHVAASYLRERVPNSTSPGVAPGLEEHLAVLCARVEAAMSSMGLSSHEKVALGIDPKAGPSASLTNVIMTDEGIVSVSSFLFRWCGLISRAYVRTLHLNAIHWSKSPNNSDLDKRLLLARPDLIVYWLRIFSSFATTGTHALVPFRPSTPREVINFEQLAWSMEFFAVAHEYAHHALGHRSTTGLKAQEFEADALAAKVCERLEFYPVPGLSNPYNRTGAGATILLGSLDLLEATRRELYGRELTFDTHPSCVSRQSRIANRHVLQPKQFEMDTEFNGTARRILDCVGVLMREFMDRFGGELAAFSKSATI